MDIADDKDDVQHDAQDCNADLPATPPRSERGFMGSPGTSKTEVAYYQPPVSEGYTGDGDDGASTDSGLSWSSTPGSEVSTHVKQTSRYLYARIPDKHIHF